MHQILHADCLAAMRGMGADTFDAVVTDPPAGISFMGKEWDSFGGRGNKSAQADCENERARAASRRQKARGDSSFAYTGQPFAFSGSALGTPKQRGAFVAFMTEVMSECLRVIKPGAYALVWAIPRTSHWTATAIEDAGWEVCDKIYHLFGQGFPKHKSKLKPAAEEWILCRRPARHATPLNIDGCRIGTELVKTQAKSHEASCFIGLGASGFAAGCPESSRSGRWPANLVLSHHPGCVPCGTKRVKGITGGTGNHPGRVYGTRTNEGQPVRDYADADGMETVETWACVKSCPIRLLDEQAGERKSHDTTPGGQMLDSVAAGSVYNCNLSGTFKVKRPPGRGDSGGPSRFYFCSKASKKDRGEGNSHPTVKPHMLMRWLVRLVTPPGGHVLDPFAGSGSTGLACAAEGLQFTGIERDQSYVRIARRRLAACRAERRAAA